MQYFFLEDLFLQVTGFTPGRIAALLPVVLGLISVIVGALALARSARRIISARSMTFAALVLGLIGIVLSVRHLLTATGAIGSGSGRLGAIVALVLGSTGAILAMIALNRSGYFKKPSKHLP